MFFIKNIETYVRIVYNKNIHSIHAFGLIRKMRKENDYWRESVIGTKA